MRFVWFLVALLVAGGLVLAGSGTGDGTAFAVEGDLDNDGVPDAADNCVLNFNPWQEDMDGDGEGDACDPDVDGDQVSNSFDNCPADPNPDQTDSDGDGWGDVCDPPYWIVVSPPNPTTTSFVRIYVFVEVSSGCYDLSTSHTMNGLTINITGVVYWAVPPGTVCTQEITRVSDYEDIGYLTTGTYQVNVNAGGQSGSVSFTVSGSGDMDNDTVLDGVDNCPSDVNPSQTDADGDGFGDVCDADDDNDGVSDFWDWCDGTIPGNPVDVNGCPYAPVDQDIDGLCNPGVSSVYCTGYDNCPSAYNPAQEDFDADTVGDPCDADDDSDGYDDAAESQIGTGSLAQCGTNGWPSDFVAGGVPDSTDRVNVLDIISFIAPVRRLNTSPPEAEYADRWDLVPGAGLFPKVINVTDLTALISGPTGFPPMLGGARAFNGPACLWAP